MNIFIKILIMVFDKNDEHYREIIATLMFISKITQNLKIDTQTLTLWEPSWYSFLWRRWNGETCEDTLKFLDKTYNKALSLIETYEERRDQQKFVECLIKCIKDSQKGVDALMKTYASNDIFVSRLTALKMALNNKIEKYDHNE